MSSVYCAIELLPYRACVCFVLKYVAPLCEEAYMLRGFVERTDTWHNAHLCLYVWPLLFPWPFTVNRCSTAEAFDGVEQSFVARHRGLCWHLTTCVLNYGSIQYDLRCCSAQRRVTPLAPNYTGLGISPLPTPLNAVARNWGWVLWFHCTTYARSFLTYIWFLVFLQYV